MIHNLQDDEYDPQLRWLNIFNPVSRRDAAYATGLLDGLLLHERTSARTRSSSSSSNSPLRTGLYLHCTYLSHQVAMEFVDYLRQTNELYALTLSYIPVQHYPHLLQALHNNTSIKELHIISVEGNADNEEENNFVFGESIALLLQHKSDFQVLVIDQVHFCFIPMVLPFFHRGYPHLLKLRFHDCGINDDEFEALIQAMVEGNRHTGNSLKELNFSCNHITARALQTFCLMTPAEFQYLQKLILHTNPNLLDDEEINQRFLQTIVISPDARLKELGLAFCSSKAAGYTTFIKTVETNRTLLRLDITENSED